MDDNLYQTETNFKGESKIKEFFKKNKIILISTISIIIIFLVYLNFHFENKKNKKILLSDNYIQAKILVENEKKDEAEKILKEIVFSNDSTYSVLALFLLLDINPGIDKNEILNLFDHILNNLEFDSDIKNLIILKKAIFQSSFVEEKDLLESLKPILNEGTIWKPHALLLLGDYYLSKQEKLKAKQFYNEILSLKKIDKEFYNRASIQLSLISND